MGRVTPERLHSLLKYDTETGDFTWRQTRSRGAMAGSTAGCPRPDGYIKIKVDGVNYLAHRLVWLYVHGKWPTGEIDHKDEDKSNNCLRNLQDGSRSQNQHNQSAPMVDASSGYRGVSACSGKYRARIKVDGVTHALGYFDSPEAAHMAYMKAKKQLHPSWSHHG